MTTSIYFFAEQLFLKYVKDSLKSYKDTGCEEEDYQVYAICLIQLACALEGTLNQIYSEWGKFKHYEKLSVKEKIENIKSYYKKEVDWGKDPWNHINQLVNIRNWLVHFKDPYIGLLGFSNQKYIKDDVNKLPKFEPDKVFTRNTVKRYYVQTLKALSETSKLALPKSDNFEYLITEQYRVLQVGG